MNLLSITSGAIAAVNPQIRCALQISIGYREGIGMMQEPLYQTFRDIPCQVQSLSGRDLRMLDGVNLQGTMRVIYLMGNIEGVNRGAVKGGDLFIMPSLPSFPGPTTWLTTQVLEHWDGASGWTKCAVMLQLTPNVPAPSET